MNRVVASSIISIFIIALLAVGYYYFSVYKEKFSKPEEALPASAALILKGNINDIYSELGKQGIWSQLDSLSLMNDIKKEFEVLLQNTSDKSEIADLLESEQTLVSLHITGADKADLLFVMPSPKDISIASMRKTLLGERPDEYRQRSFSGKDIYEVSFPYGWQFTFSVSNGVFIGSFTAGLVEDAIRQQETGKAFWGNKSLEDLFTSVSSSAKYSLALNYAQLTNLFSLTLIPDVTDKLDELATWAGWSVHSLSFSGNQIIAKGFILASDSTQIIYGFNNCHGAASDIIKVLSQNTVAYQTYSFSDECSWMVENKKRMAANEYVKIAEKAIASAEKTTNIAVRKKIKELIDKEVSLALDGNPSGTLDNNTLAFVKVKNMKTALQTLGAIDKVWSKNAGQLAVEKYKDHEIRLLNVDGLLPVLFGNSFSVIRKNYYTVQNNFLVFANKPSLLRRYIDDVEGGLLLKRLPESMQSEISRTTNNMYTLLIRPEQCTPIWQTIASEATKQMLSRSNYLERINTFYYTISNVQNSEGNCTFVITTQNPGQRQAASQLWSFFADTTIRNGPSVFTRDDEVFILYQDDAFMLHCLDKNGNNNWSFPVDSAIEGSIGQAPYDSDGKMQFAFTTNSKVYVLSESGSVAAKYPVKLPFTTSNGIASSSSSGVYFVACDNQIIYPFEYGGRPARNWSTIKWSGSAWQYSFSPDGRAVVFADNQNLTLYTMDGVNRLLKPVTDFNLLNYWWSQDSVSQFVCQDKEGSQIRINPDGTFGKIAGNPAYQMIGQTKEGEVMMSYVVAENKLLKLSADNKTVVSAELKGQVIKSKLATGAGGTYCIIVADKLLYVFNQQLKPVQGFPMQANSFVVTSVNQKMFLLSLTGADKLTLFEL